MSTKYRELERERWKTHRVAEYLSKSPVTLQRWRSQGEGPPYSKVGHTIYYNVAKLMRWLDSHEVRHDPLPDPSEVQDAPPEPETSEEKRVFSMQTGRFESVKGGAR
jgi:hypothetical protein